MLLSRSRRRGARRAETAVCIDRQAFLSAGPARCSSAGGATIVRLIAVPMVAIASATALARHLRPTGLADCHAGDRLRPDPICCPDAPVGADAERPAMRGQEGGLDRPARSRHASVDGAGELAPAATEDLIRARACTQVGGVDLVAACVR